MKNSLKTPMGDDIYVYPRAIVLKFQGQRNVISTSLLNGGYSENIKYVYNYDGKKGDYNEYDLEGLSYEEHLTHVAHQLGIAPEKTTGISTTADMKNTSINIESYNGLSICTLITAGVKGNSGRAGDPSSFDERELTKSYRERGTINIILLINANLSPGTLTRALITCTEAKSVALQELLIGSKYSHSLATGTGTDGCIIIGNMDSSILLTNAGKHSKLGELIGKAVIKGVKRAIEFQENINSISQGNLFSRLNRFQITPDALFAYYQSLNEKKKISRGQFQKLLDSISQNREISSIFSNAIHLLDEFLWNILTEMDLITNLNFLFRKESEPHFKRELINNEEYQGDFFASILTHLKDFLIKEVLREYKN